MKYFNVAILFLISAFACAQENTTGEIIISRAHLISILEKFKDVASQESITTAREHQNKWVVTDFTTIDSTQVKIKNLQHSIVELQHRIDSMGVSNRNSSLGAERVGILMDSVFNENQQKTIYIKEKAVQNTPVVQWKNNAQIDQLNTKIDRLIAQQLLMQAALLASTNKKQEVQRDTVYVVQKVLPTEKRVEEKEDVVTTIGAKPIVSVKEFVERTDYEKLEEQYGNYNEAVYFTNNSIMISGKEANATLYNIIQILYQNPTVDVYLKGFASAVGSKLYNDKISFSRTIAVKQYLIDKGILPSRILSYHLGIDVEAASSAAARRVGISFVIRK